MGPVVLNKATISIPEVQVSFGCELSVAPDAGDPDEDLRPEQIHRERPQRVFGLHLWGIIVRERSWRKEGVQ